MSAFENASSVQKAQAAFKDICEAMSSAYTPTLIVLTWKGCGACAQFLPRLKEFIQSYAPGVPLHKIPATSVPFRTIIVEHEIAEHIRSFPKTSHCAKQIIAHIKVNSFPTLLRYYSGEFTTLVGSVDKRTLCAFVKKNLNTIDCDANL